MTQRNLFGRLVVPLVCRTTATSSGRARARMTWRAGRRGPATSNSGGPSSTASTASIFVAVASAAPAAAAGGPDGMRNSLGAMSSRKNLNSLSVSAGLSGAAAAPSTAIASRSSTKSGLLASARATRSPRRTPSYGHPSRQCLDPVGDLSVSQCPAVFGDDEGLASRLPCAQQRAERLTDRQAASLGHWPASGYPLPTYRADDHRRRNSHGPPGYPYRALRPLAIARTAAL